MTGKEILKKAIKTYGEEAQMRQCMEECAELLEAILQTRAVNAETEGVVLEEEVDVSLTTTQVAMILGKEIEEANLPMLKVVEAEEIEIILAIYLAKLIKKINKWFRYGATRVIVEEIMTCISFIQTAIELRNMKNAETKELSEKFSKKATEKLKRLKDRLEVGSVG